MKKKKEYCKNGDVRFNLMKKGASKYSQIWMVYNLMATAYDTIPEKE